MSLAWDFHSNVMCMPMLDCCVLTVVATPSSVLPRLSRFESGVSPRTDDLFSFPIVYEDVLTVSALHLHRRSSTVSRVCNLQQMVRRVMVAAGWEISIRREADSVMPGRRSRDPRRFESCLPSGRRAYCEEREGGRANDEAKEKERRALRGSRKRTVTRPVAN